ITRPSGARTSRPSGEISAISVSPSPTPISLADSAGRRTARLLPHFDTMSSIRKFLVAIASPAVSTCRYIIGDNADPVQMREELARAFAEVPEKQVEALVDEAVKEARTRRRRK